MWQFKALPFGLSRAPHTFTKLLKPVVSTLWRQGICLILYLDDILIMAQNRHEIKLHIVNMKKSVFGPAQVMEFLGFSLDTSAMTISIPKQKLSAIQRMASQLL